MASKRQVDVTIDGKDRLKPVLKGAGGDVDAFGNRIKGLLNPVNLLKGGLASLGVLGFGALGKKAVESASESEAAWARVESAVENAGITFRRVRGDLDELFTSIQRTTRYSDDQAADAFASLMSITGDYAGSVKNLALATDIAAAKKIDLTTAATLVGKAAVGETGQLKKMGIVLADTSKAIEELSGKFGGFAARDAASMQGQLQQVANAWDNVLEAMGRAILGMGGATDTSVGLANALNGLATWIDTNRGYFNDLAEGAKNLWMWLLKITDVGNIASGAIEGYDKLFTVIAKVTGFDPDGGPEDAGDGAYYKALGRIRARARQRAEEEQRAAAAAAITARYKSPFDEADYKRGDKEAERVRAMAAGVRVGVSAIGETPTLGPVSTAAVPPLDLGQPIEQIGVMKAAFLDMDDSIRGIAKGGILEFADTWAAATQEIVDGSLSIGNAIVKAGRKAVGGVLIAKGRETMLDAAKAAVMGFTNPAEFLKAGKLFLIGTAQTMAGQLFSGGGSGGGGGSAGGLGESGFNQQSAETGRATKAEIVVQNQFLNMNDPAQREQLSDAIFELYGLRIIFTGGNP